MSRALTGSFSVTIGGVVSDGLEDGAIERVGSSGNASLRSVTLSPSVSSLNGSVPFSCSIQLGTPSPSTSGFVGVASSVVRTTVDVTALGMLLVHVNQMPPSGGPLAGGSFSGGHKMQHRMTSVIACELSNGHTKTQMAASTYMRRPAISCLRGACP